MSSGHDTARMAQVWAHQLGRHDVRADTDLFELGVESLVVARLVVAIEREFDVELSLDTLFAHPTVGGLVAAIRAAREPAPRRPSLIMIEPAGDRRPLFGVHGGAGTILLFRDLARRMARDGHPFYALQAQGLYGLDPVHTTVEQMAAAYVGQIREVQPNGPFTLIGYCYGALVAHEMVRLLAADGDRVDLLVAINGPTVAYLRRHDPRGGLLDEQTRRASGLRRRAISAVRYRRNEVVLQQSLRRGRPLPAWLREAYIFQLLSIRAQFAYDQQRVEVPVLVAAAAGWYREADLGWSACTAADVECVQVVGRQPTLRHTMKEPVVGAVARRLAARLIAS